MSMDIFKMITAGPSAPFSGAMLEDLQKMEQNLCAARPAEQPLSGALERILRSGGKRLRPLLAWLSWHYAGGKGEIVPLMTMLELMHTSSLVHDDFVDGAAERRGVATINAVEGADVALRSGDYLLAYAMDYLKLYRGMGINEALSAVAQEMCLGELDQHAGLFDVSNAGFARYRERIRRKTALLISECCRCGAVAGGAEKEMARSLADFGEHLGMAFQMRDDLLDWEDRKATGKARMQDVKSGVITLPQLYAMEERGAELLPLLQKREKNKSDLNRIRAIITKSDALGKTHTALQEECNAALECLAPLPECAEKTSLQVLTNAISEVKYCG